MSWSIMVVTRSSWSVSVLLGRRGQSSWSVVLCGQSFFMVSLLDCRGQSWWSLVLRGQSVVLVLVVSRRGQSFFLIVVSSLLRGQSLFVDGVYILWWLSTRIY